MVHIIPCRSIECIDLNCFQQLPCVRYFTVPSVCLEGCWRSLLSSIAVILYGWYNADWQVVLIFFFFFSCSFLVQGKNGEKKRPKKRKKKKEDIYINNCNNYNYDCNKQKPRTINVGVQCLISAEPASGTKSTFKPPPRQHIHNIQTDARTDRHTCIWRKSTFGSVKRCMSIWVLMPSNILINVCTSIQGLIIIMCFYMLTGLWGTILITYSMPTQKGVIVFPMRLSFSRCWLTHLYPPSYIQDA